VLDGSGAGLSITPASTRLLTLFPSRISPHGRRMGDDQRGNRRERANFSELPLEQKADRAAQ
jgi:hypothetical protein